MNPSEFLIVGAKGQLGLALQAQYPGAQAADVSELDITNLGSVANYDWSKVKVILNAAAYTNVEEAENPEGRIAAWKVNATAVGYLAKIANKYGLTLVHISTAYVFNGTLDMHKEDEPLSPLSSYGSSKAAGDVAASQADKFYIIRSSAVIGDGKNFVRSIFEAGKKGISPSVVSDETDRPTFTSELVKGIDFLLTKQAPYGIYNVTNSGDVVTWADLARVVYKEAGFDSLVVSDSTAAKYFAGKAIADKRPIHGALALSKMEKMGFMFTDWREDLKIYIEKELVS
ncbi:MAG TPA: NAD(P)-dependent oxidoreductase [Candidatus Saccharimonadales bacterium]|nr:NAD(P)-dependent oxidoreductase [Candidatus Saccharimonadales bacterium]